MIFALYHVQRNSVESKLYGTMTFLDIQKIGELRRIVADANSKKRVMIVRMGDFVLMFLFYKCDRYFCLLN